MTLTASESRIRRAVMEDMEALLDRRGMLRPETPGLHARMTTHQVAEALGGLHPQTIRRNWKAWGLRRLGRGKSGTIYCGVSVARHIEQQQQTEVK